MSTNITVNCLLAYSKLTTPMTSIYAIMFIFVGLLATAGNILALVILLQPQRRLKSNKILVSLVLSDTLVGIVLCPLTTYKLIETKTLQNCKFEHAGFYLSVLLIGTSSINVSLIAFDRYILLTRLRQTDTRTTRSKSLLILISWLLPPTFISLKWVSVYVYTPALCMITFIPLVCLLVFYRLIVKATKRKEKEMFSSQSTDDVQRIQTSTIRKMQYQRHFRLARQVSILILFYVMCMIPPMIGLILNMIYAVTTTEKPTSLQNFLMFTLLAGSSNSAINPMIYALKYPEFRCTLRKWIGKKERNNSCISRRTFYIKESFVIR